MTYPSTDRKTSRERPGRWLASVPQLSLLVALTVAVGGCSDSRLPSDAGGPDGGRRDGHVGDASPRDGGRGDAAVLRQ